jgi:hypothetical protein
VNRYPALFVALCLATTMPLSAQTAPPASGSDWNAQVRAQVLTGVESALDSYFFADKVAGLKAAVEADRAALVAIDDPEKFTRAVTGDMYAVVHDKHLRLSYSPEPLPDEKPGKPTPSQLAHMAQVARFMDYGYSSSARLPGNIGYLRIAFFTPLSQSKTMYDTAMALVGNTDGLVVDLRNNAGGDPEAVDYLLGYLFAKPVEVSGFLWRDGAKTLPQRMFSAKVDGRPYVDKPVYVLVNGGTFSGGEQFAYDVKSLHRAQLVGATTAGGANPGAPVRLDEHFRIFVPTGMPRNPYTGTNWEGVGVAPDVVSSSNDALLTAYKIALKSVSNSFGPATRDRNMALDDPAGALNIALPAVAASSDDP